ncbi:MAG: MEMO1 family protein, partial [bacterium]
QSALAGMRKLVKEKNPIIFSCVDFSHIGPKFGWEKPVGVADLRALETYERELLSHIEKGNPRDFISLIAQKRNATNVDAVGAVYTLLNILPSPRFRLLHYEISYEEATASAVSFASLVAF